jgi:hypothetical protein
MKTGLRANICRSVCFAQIGWRVGKRRTISNLGRENLPYYLNCFTLFGWKSGSGWYQPSLQLRSARGTGLRFALFHSMAKSGRYTPISWLVCFAQIGWRGGKRRIHTAFGREKKPYWMNCFAHLGRKAESGWYRSNCHPYPRPNKLPWLTPPTHTPLATSPREQANLAYPTQHCTK